MSEEDVEAQLILDTLKSDPRFGIREQCDVAVGAFNKFRGIDGSTNILAWILLGMLASSMIAVLVCMWRLERVDKVRILIAFGVALVAIWFEVKWADCGL